MPANRRPVLLFSSPVLFATLAVPAAGQMTTSVSVSLVYPYQGNHASHRPAISADGRYVAFLSDATDLVFGDTNGFLDVFVRDRVSATTERANVDSQGMQANGFSLYGTPAARR